MSSRSNTAVQMFVGGDGLIDRGVGGVELVGTWNSCFGCLLVACLVLQVDTFPVDKSPTCGGGSKVKAQARGRYVLRTVTFWKDQASVGGGHSLSAPGLGMAYQIHHESWGNPMEVPVWLGVC